MQKRGIPKASDRDDPLGPRVAITYEGTLAAHRELVVPLLRELSLVATFFARAPELLDHVEFWRSCAKEGHEIANGALCGFESAEGCYPLWTAEMLAAEVAAGDALLQELGFGPRPFSIAAPTWPVITAYGRLYPEEDDRQVRVVQTLKLDSKFSSAQQFVIRASPVWQEWESQTLERIDSLKQEDELVLTFRGIGEGEDSIDRASHERLVRSIAANPRLRNCTLRELLLRDAAI